MPFPTTHPSLARALEAQGYLEPTPVQEAVLDAGGDRDLLVSAQTGSGKTVAFGLAAAKPLLGEDERFGDAALPLCLAIAPTRELALQVARELTWLYAPAGGKIVTCVGGMDQRKEQRALSFGAHIVVGTPGRLRDHLERGNLDLSALRVAVLDEADEMLDMGFREDLEEILDSTPKDRRTFLFSATIAKDIATLARRYQNDALRIDTIRRDEAHGDIEYRAIRVAPNEVESAVVNLLRFFESPGALVFCNTREAVNRLSGALRERGFAAVTLSGELSQKERADALQALRDGHARACVATDVAARGLDLPDLGLVIHAELPVNKAGLLHRSGRTGRAGKKGVSALIVPYTRQRKADQLLYSANIEAQWGGPPSADEIRALDQQRLLADPVLSEEPSPEDLVLAQRILENRSPEAVAAALIRMHRARLPEPEEMFDNVRERASEPRPPRDEREMRRFEPLDGEARDTTWFRLTIGRSKNADPKWILPLICRLGHVTKKDIGAIRIFDRETKFEINNDAHDRFIEALKTAIMDPDVKVEPSAAPGPRPPREEGERPFRKPRTDGDRPFRKGSRPEGDRPAYAKGPRPDGDKPFHKGPRPEGKPAYAKGPRPEGDKPFHKGPRPESDKPFHKGPRPESAPYAKPAFAKPAYAGGPRPDGDRPYKGPREDGKPAFKRKGPPPKGGPKPRKGKGKPNDAR